MVIFCLRRRPLAGRRGRPRRSGRLLRAAADGVGARHRRARGVDPGGDVTACTRGTRRQKDAKKIDITLVFKYFRVSRNKNFP